MDKVITSLIHPQKLWSRDEILSRPCPAPRNPGVYGWYFKEIPPCVPTDGCATWGGLTLLYLGISPSSKTSQRNLAGRIRFHFCRDASRSTLRKSLGCLLSERLGLQLQKVGSRIHFNEGEENLSQWMAENAYVAWVVREAPWEIEGLLIGRLNLPLNLRGNESHPFYPTLSAIRRRCREGAR